MTTAFLFAASLFFTSPAPLEMPRAKAFLAHDSSRTWLEDRYDPLDLWTSQSVDGRWTDATNRTFLIATLATRPPALANADVETRVSFADARRPITRRQIDYVREAAECLAPIELAEKARPPEQTPRGYADVDYWQGTNTSAIVCTFRVKESDVWHLATWTLNETDDYDESLKLFEDEFLDKECLPFLARLKTASTPSEDAATETSNPERNLLRADARHSVAAYEAWHVTDAPTYALLDDIAGPRDFMAAITNALASVHAAATNALPTSLDTSNTLCVARIFASRSEYLDALVDNEKSMHLLWSAAYWCPQRRELVAYLPWDDTKGLVETIRHEAFHQYLSYATAMIATSPWLNEGYAEYFENTNSLNWQLGFELRKDDLTSLAKCIPGLLRLDYPQFYDDETILGRHMKYRLAWSIAAFIENGAPKVRFNPFKDLKRNYVDTLLRTQDALKATDAAFGSKDNLDLFVSEWRRWWKEHLGEP
jgi:hypothetical protein